MAIESNRRFLALFGGAHWAPRTQPTSWVDAPRNCAVNGPYTGGPADLTTREDAFARVAEWNRLRVEEFGDGTDAIDVEWAFVVEVGVSLAVNSFKVSIDEDCRAGTMRQEFVTELTIVVPSAKERRRYAIPAGELVGA